MCRVTQLMLDQYWLRYVRILRLRLRASRSTALPMCPSSFLDVRPSMFPLYHSTHPARDASTSRAPAEVREGQPGATLPTDATPGYQHRTGVDQQVPEVPTFDLQRGKDPHQQGDCPHHIHQHGEGQSQFTVGEAVTQRHR